VAIVERFAKEDARISYKQNPVNLGVNGAFQEAIRLSSPCDFYCLSDQDDIWPLNRIDQFLNAAEKISKERPDESLPTLFVCQYEAFDHDQPRMSGITSAELLHIGRENIDWKKTLLAGNSLYGCCFFFNHSLKLLIERIPPGKTTHDYWIALVAAHVGRVVILPFTGTFYRQHSSNASYGAPSSNWIVKFRRIMRSLNEDIRSRQDMSSLFSELLAQHSGALSYKEKNRLAAASKSYLKGAGQLFLFQLRNRAWRLNFSGNLLRALACLMEARKRNNR